MIVIPQQRPHRVPRASYAEFERMLPQIREQARVAFRFARPEAQAELVQEVVAKSFVAFARLLERNKADLAYPTLLAQYAIRQTRAGRCVGCHSNVRDVSSRYAQRAQGIIVERLDRFDANVHEWREALIEDRRAGPAETAAARIDLAAWLQSLTRKQRGIAGDLAQGEATGRVAQKFGISAGRVSQLRRELENSWREFQGLPTRE